MKKPITHHSSPITLRHTPRVSGDPAALLRGHATSPVMQALLDLLDHAIDECGDEIRHPRNQNVHRSIGGQDKLVEFKGNLERALGEG